jgi:hypothetical protein
MSVHQAGWPRAPPEREENTELLAQLPHAEVDLNALAGDRLWRFLDAFRVEIDSTSGAVSTVVCAREQTGSRACLWTARNGAKRMPIALNGRGCDAGQGEVAGQRRAKPSVHTRVVNCTQGC